MKHLVITAALTTLVSGAFVPAVSAQPPGPMPYVRPATSPYYRPPVSPYINLARPGFAGINYYGLVRPQLQANNAIQQLQQEQLLLEQQQTGLEVQTGLNQIGTTGSLTTGHPAGFQNHTGYFMNWAARSGGSPGRSGISTVPPAAVVGGNFGKAPASSAGRGPRR